MSSLHEFPEQGRYPEMGAALRGLVIQGRWTVETLLGRMPNLHELPERGRYPEMGAALRGFVIQGLLFYFYLLLLYKTIGSDSRSISSAVL